MSNTSGASWENMIVTPAEIMEKIEPGMSIFLGTGMGEPRTIIKHLINARGKNLQDLELIQLGSFGDIISIKEPGFRKFRLKTFFSGWLASEAFAEGRVDLIPSRPSRILQLFESGQIPIDMAFFQITPPNASGYCNLGVSADVALQAMEQASLAVGEVNSLMPCTFGDTFLHVSELDMLIRSTEPPIYFPRPEPDDIYDKVAFNVASVIEDGSCIAFTIGPLFESLGRHLQGKRHLGVHTPFFTDALMDLMKSGAVTNRRKGNWRGKSVASYALGSPELMNWLDGNPLVEFQGIDKVFNPIQIGRNPRVVVVIVARKVDITGRTALPLEQSRRLVTGRGGGLDFFNGAELSASGLKLIALPSRDNHGNPNILLSVEDFPFQFSVRESVDMIITEYGVANLNGRTIRERAQALIDIAHPDDRAGLVEQAKKANILYKDQIFLSESANLYPADIKSRQVFKGGAEVRFRALRPSDEEDMRRLFYGFSDRAVYYRYFSPVKAMPHNKMQEYINVDLNRYVSIVGLAGEPGKERIVAEARLARLHVGPYADVAFVVDEKYQGLGIAAHLLLMLVQEAKKRGIKGFTADILSTNKAMLRVFEKTGFTINSRLEDGIFHLTIPFSDSILL